MIITRTPFRISFFGGGSDFPAWYEVNGGGAVLSTSIDKYCYITCRSLPPFFDHTHRIVWSKIENVRSVDEIEHPVVREALRFLDIQKGVEILYNADLPARAGLGSSSAFTVGILYALYSLLGRQVTKRQLALDAMHIEQERLKEHVGCQDQTITAFGGLNRIDFGGAQKITVQPLTLAQSRIQELQDHLMLFFTGRSRFSSEISKEHVTQMSARTRDLCALRSMVEDAIRILSSDRDITEFGALLHVEWLIKRELTPSVTTSEIDALYEHARTSGALGGKILGAGGGGFMLIFARPECQSLIREKLKHVLYVPFRFDQLGSQVIYYGAEYEDAYFTCID